MDIAGVSHRYIRRRSSIWREGVQIDMVIDRADHIVNLCEMKFSTTEYAIEKSDGENLSYKAGRFCETQKGHKAVHTILVTPFGIEPNMYQYSVQNVVTAEALFKE